MNAQAAATSSQGSKTTAGNAVDRDPHQIVLIDLGKASASRVKRLRQGGGKLMQDVEAALAELRGSGEIGADSQAVVVIVERKRKRPSLFP